MLNLKETGKELSWPVSKYYADLCLNAFGIVSISGERKNRYFLKT
jgi:hypothetical protein